jgi:hypothetical protein
MICSRSSSVARSDPEPHRATPDPLYQRQRFAPPALANIAATVVNIKVPQTSQAAVPISVQDERTASDVPNVARTVRSVLAVSSRTRTISSPRLAWPATSLK